MDWFAKDLLLDSFHDAFTTLFGDDYEQVYICEQLEQSHSVIYKYAEQFVQKVMQEALDIVKSQSTHNELADVSLVATCIHKPPCTTHPTHI